MIALVLQFIGGLVVGIVTYQVLKELVRAFRQSQRVVTIATRKYTDRRKPTLKERWWGFKRELLRGYTTLEIHDIVIPHDPSQPIRGKRFR